MAMRVIAVILLCAVMGGCWDFVEPDLATENGAGVLQLSASIDKNGNLQLGATLSPGLDEDGFPREVAIDTLRVLNFAVPSDSVLPNGNHVYTFSSALGRAALSQPMRVQGPFLEDVRLAPAAQWYSARKTDPDTLRITRGSELVLHIAADTTQTTPPAFAQWTLELTGRDRRFQILSNGHPPAELRVPPSWIPQVSDSVLRVSFSTFQSTQMILPSYRAFMSYTAFTDWTVIVR
jgi:hypothetical protein